MCGLAGAKYTGPGAVPDKAPGYGALALTTFGANPTALPAFTEWSEAWSLFSTEGGFHAADAAPASAPSNVGVTVNGAVASTMVLAPGASREVVFCLAWRYPNKYNGSGTWMGCHYAEQWKSVDAVAQALAIDFPKMRARTERFRKAMYDTTLPYWLVDCVTSQISTIRHSGVVFRIANGDVLRLGGLQRLLRSHLHARLGI